MNKSKSLTPALLHILKDKGTEHPRTGVYEKNHSPGTYLCRQCGLALFRADHKFPSACGWPSFDDALPDAVYEQADQDGQRIEIVCARCGGHLGHVFRDENLTGKNTRHCVNSASLDFVENQDVLDTEEALFAGGCFWGVEYFFQKLPGVLKTEVGYTGGHTANPTYKSICTGNTGHFEAIRIVYDKAKLTFEKVAQYFFETHDPTQTNGQGPDLGTQYLSRIFYYSDEQKAIAQQLIHRLEKKGLTLATQLFPVSIFWPAEDFHQNYYAKMNKSPYCHAYKKLF